MATLVVDTTSGPVAIQLRGACVVGRDDACAVRIDHPTLSRRHARLTPAGDAWLLEDLGSQNGCRLDGKRIEGAVALHDGAQLRLGRIRAWFFVEHAPIGWTPDVAGGAPKAMDGHTASCPHCGASTWAPAHAAGLQLKCKSCGQRLAIEAPAQRPIAQNPLGECAACHTEIVAGEAAHVCPACNAAHHADCWADNHGCATYGCAQAQALAPASTDMLAQQDDVEPRASRVSPVEIAGVTLAGLAGLVAFGAPALGAGAWLLVRRRAIAGTASLLIGVAGVVVSGVWWLGWLR